MTAQDRFFVDRAAAHAAPPPPPPPAKPKAHGHALVLTKIVSLGASLSGAASVFMGTLPASGSGDIKGYALSTVAAIALGLGSASIWHVLSEIGAHATELHRKIIALAFGVGMVGFGSLTSGSFLASNIGGAGAIQVWQHQAIERLKKSRDDIAGHAATDAPLLAAVENGGEAFNRAAGSEASSGAVAPRHKAGQGVAFNSISNAADNTQKVAAKMRDKANTRAQLLRTAQAAIIEAENDILGGDAAQFEDAYGRASQALGDAERIHLSAEASSLGVGWIVHPSAAPFINGTLRDMETAKEIASQNRRPVSVPTYTAIDERSAVVKNPPFLAWVCALLIETAPCIMLGLLLLLWRDENDQDQPDYPIPLYVPLRPSPQPSPQAAE